MVFVHNMIAIWGVYDNYLKCVLIIMYQILDIIFPIKFVMGVIPAV